MIKRLLTNLFWYAWHAAEYLSDGFESQAMHYRSQYLKLLENPIKGRHVRWIETTGDMGQDKGVAETGVVIRTYTDVCHPETQKIIFVEVRMETGRSICFPLRAFYENPEDGALEYRY